MNISKIMRNVRLKSCSFLANAGNIIRTMNLFLVIELLPILFVLLIL